MDAQTMINADQGRHRSKGRQVLARAVPAEEQPHGLFPVPSGRRPDARRVGRSASSAPSPRAVSGGDVVARDGETAGGFYFVPNFNDRQAWEDDPKRVAEIDAFIAECEQATGISAGRILLAGERDLGRGYSRPIYYWFHNRDGTARACRQHRALPHPAPHVRLCPRYARCVPPRLVLAGEWADALCFTFYLVGAAAWAFLAWSTAIRRS